MLNQKYYPFERNRYYFGKLLTAKDFENEQTYFNGKRRLMNHVLAGSGVVCGLNVYAGDDLSVVIETGIAIDELGREIVVDEPVIKKLTTIEGFEKIVEEEAYLGISYAENITEPIYAAMGEENTEYNKVREGYRLFLEEEDEIEKPIKLLTDFIIEEIIYQDEEIKLIQYLPKFVEENKSLNIKVVLKKMSGSKQNYDIGYELELQGFKSCDGKTKLPVSFEGCSLCQGEEVVMTYTLIPNNVIDKNLIFKIKRGSFYKEANGQKEFLERDFEFLLNLKQTGMWEWIQEEYYKNSLDDKNIRLNGKKIWLAKIKLIRVGNELMIDKIKPLPFKQYLYTPEQLMIGEQLKSYYSEKKEKTKEYVLEENKNEVIMPKQTMKRDVATGIVEIPIDVTAGTKEVIYSDEIMHGLGSEPVYIDLGVEYIHDNKEGLAGNGEIILGNAELFEEVITENIKFSYGIKIYKEKGTFVIALKLKEAVRAMSIRIRWYAFRATTENTQISSKQSLEGRQIKLTPDTIVLKPHETVSFTPLFFNMDEEACAYEVLEADGGSITEMGVYTAPAKEGVYTITAKTFTTPQISSNAFVVVKQ